ncbi:hypothetical protein [Dyadobacter diqingensis]|uniref:hypothetical protein n=1 Tax=Dyadobacter diqingensis TaxID=2938121 RepID=UPI0020C48FC5|nr:hypothetical protein [Dyadobacter diqingensis]
MKQLLSKSCAGLSLAAGLLLSSSAVFAQVKIGTNPTVIDPANNLEVEASTAGRKTSVDKTTGQVTIKDGTEGTAKVLTSDANGVASWQNLTAPDAPVIFTVEKSGGIQALPNGSIVKSDFVTSTLDKNGSFDLTSDSFTIPANGTGYYQIASLVITNGKPHALNTYQYLFVNGANRRLVAIGNSAAGSGVVASGNIIVKLIAGDVVDLRYYTNINDVEVVVSYLDVNMIAK